MQLIKLEDLDDDGRWVEHPELGTIRSGPRGNRYWEVQSSRWFANGAPPFEQQEPETQALMEQFVTYQETRREMPNEGSGWIEQGDSAYIDPRRAPKSSYQSKQVKVERESNDGDSELLNENRFSSNTSNVVSSAGGDGMSELRPSSPATPPAAAAATAPPSPRPERPNIMHLCLPQPDCVCPIDLECQVRGGHLIDCRRLVPLWKAWRNREQPYDPMGMPEDNEEAEIFATLGQVADIIVPLQQIAVTAPLSVAMRRIHGQINVWIHNMQTLAAREDDLVACGVLPELEDFLGNDSSEMRRTKRFPPVMYDQLLAILRKWRRGDFGVRPHRGFIRCGNRWVRNPDWEHVLDGRFFGHGHLINGQRFADRKQLCLEGGHAALVAGIAGTKAGGAYSVVMGLHLPKAGLVYADVDCGDTIYYMSTALQAEPGEVRSNVFDPDDEDNPVDPDTATIGAKALLRSHETGRPVRLFRSWKASKKVRHRPQQGYRYDGLYKVVDYELLKNRRQIYRFKMVREAGQNPVHGYVDPPKGSKSQQQREKATRSKRKSTELSTQDTADSIPRKTKRRKSH